MDDIGKTYANRTWIAFANESKCRHSDAICDPDCGYINWKMGKQFHFSIGDIVYLFMSDKRNIRFKMVVVEQNCPRTDTKFWIGKVPNDITYKLCLVDQYDGDKLSEKKLMQHGFGGGNSIQTPSCTNAKLIAYIDSIFDEQNKTLDLLPQKPILYVDLYAGAYCKTNIGHEYFNLDKNTVDGRYYGYCPPYGNIDITKLGANKQDESVSEVLVVYTTKIKNSSNREIIAFCKNAIVHREPICDSKILRKLKRILPDGSRQYCSFHIE